MQVKTYTGKTSQEILTRIKAELGPDAVILGSRTFQENGARLMEMTAGIDRRPAAAPAHSAAPAAAQGPDLAAAPAGTPPGWKEWHQDWMRIRDQLFSLMKPNIQLERLTPRQRVALEYLQREGVNDMVAVELYQRLLADREMPVLASLGALVPVRAFSEENWPQPVQLVTGPYGAGKTTSVLRLALHVRRLAPERRVAFINADCARGNGRMLLRHWAELSGFAYAEADDAESMRKALMTCAENADLTFIDVPGLARGEILTDWMRSRGLSNVEMAAHLVLPPHYDAVQMAAFLERYAAPCAGGIIWSKLDECVAYGALVNVACTSHLPASALSYGAGLKESLIPATETLLWRLIFKRQLPGAT